MKKYIPINIEKINEVIVRLLFLFSIAISSIIFLLYFYRGVTYDYVGFNMTLSASYYPQRLEPFCISIYGFFITYFLFWLVVKIILWVTHGNKQNENSNKVGNNSIIPWILTSIWLLINLIAYLSSNSFAVSSYGHWTGNESIFFPFKKPGSNPYYYHEPSFLNDLKLTYDITELLIYGTTPILILLIVRTLKRKFN